MHHLDAVHQVCNERFPDSYLKLLVEFAAVSVQHGQAEWPEVCIETATHRETEECVICQPSLKHSVQLHT